MLEPLPHVRTLREGVPEAVEQAINRALAVIPADRFPTVAEFAQALAQPHPAPTTLSSPAAQDRAGRRRVPVGLATLALGVLLGVGVLLAWLRSRPEAETTAVKRLAVLPFENLGDSADAYFADGVANDLRTKLSRLAGLTVIARGSSNEYKRTTKSQQQIARELGVDYLLTATVQWEKAGGGVSRVRVTPELVDVRPGHAPQTRWGESFDAALTDVFRVQADIAGQVSQALNVALGDSAKHELTSKPTQSLPAYEAFLRGEAASQGMMGDSPSLRQAIAAYEQAVALDSSFVRAWAQLARARAYCTAVAPSLRRLPRRRAAPPSGHWRSPLCAPMVTRRWARTTSS